MGAPLGAIIEIQAVGHGSVGEGGLCCGRARTEPKHGAFRTASGFLNQVHQSTNPRFGAAGRQNDTQRVQYAFLSCLYRGGREILVPRAGEKVGESVGDITMLRHYLPQVPHCRVHSSERAVIISAI